MPTLTTLVIGADAAAREAAIAQAIEPDTITAVILEGLPGAQAPLADLQETHSHLIVSRITPGCICCSGNLVMRVTLNRVLHHPPQRLFISLADFSHLDQVVLFLSREPYDKFLALTKEMQLVSRKS
ncbi:MAG: GTPase [Proteobacteria bacterium]|nr:GTPase [Pseudomonadota bacterium]